MSEAKINNLHNHNTRKLCEEEVLTIRHRLNNGEKQKVLVKEYSVSKYTIQDIKYRRTWKHI